MTKRRWRKGEKIQTPERAIAWLAAHRPIYWHDKWTHASWALSWQCQMLINAARHGVISEAIKIEDEET